MMDGRYNLPPNTRIAAKLRYFSFSLIINPLSILRCFYISSVYNDSQCILHNNRQHSFVHNSSAVPTLYMNV